MIEMSFDVGHRSPEEAVHLYFDRCVVGVRKREPRVMSKGLFADLEQRKQKSVETNLNSILCA